MIKNLANKFPKNTIHLAAGSKCPPLQNDLLRIYSMFFCPYAQRTRMVLIAKNIKHETVNVHLVKKPDWFLKINPLGKVPILQLNDKIMFESMTTCDYLDEIYANPPLYPNDPWAKGVDKCLIDVFEAKVIRYFFKMFINLQDEEGMKTLVESLNIGLDLFETELEKRRTKFFFGDRPGMLDYAIFPWFERIPILNKFFPDSNIFSQERFPKLMEFYENMLKDNAAISTVTDFDDHVQFFVSKLEGNINYDIGVTDETLRLQSHL